MQGANGSGKSTLLRLLAGALAPRHGAFELAGCRYAAGDRAAPLAWRQQTFWCLSDPPPTPWLTVAECLGFVSGTYPGVDAARVREQVDGAGPDEGAGDAAARRVAGPATQDAAGARAGAAGEAAAAGRTVQCVGRRVGAATWPTRSRRAPRGATR